LGPGARDWATRTAHLPVGPAQELATGLPPMAGAPEPFADQQRRLRAQLPTAPPRGAQTADPVARTDAGTPARSGWWLMAVAAAIPLCAFGAWEARARFVRPPASATASPPVAAASSPSRLEVPTSPVASASATADVPSAPGVLSARASVSAPMQPAALGTPAMPHASARPTGASVRPGRTTNAGGATPPRPPPTSTARAGQIDF
jgi:hypothetical protein